VGCRVISSIGRSERWLAPEPRPAFALALVLGLGFTARTLVVLDPPCLPGDDGAYYLVQVRGILRGEGLPIPDLPLLFYALAGIARILMVFLDPAQAVVAAVSWADALWPLSLALPVYALARDMAPGRTALATLLAGLLAVASGNVLVMAGGMIKNGAALPLCLAYIYLLAHGARRRSRRTLALAALCLVASSLTHLSALAVNLAFTLPWAVMRLVRRRDWRVLLLAGGLSASAAAVFRLDPARGARLVGTFLRPWSAVSPDWGAAIEQPAVWLGNALGFLGLAALWRMRSELEPWAKDLLGAASLATLALACPLLRPDLMERLALVSLFPGLVPAVFLAGRPPAGPALLAPLLALALGHGFLAVRTLRATGLVRPAWEELQALRAVVPAGPRIVMVRPLLRWWAAWTLDSRFSTSAAGALSDRAAGAAVLLLEEVRDGAFGQTHSSISASPGAALRDGALLQDESFDVLREGTYFRLSRLLPRSRSGGSAGAVLPAARTGEDPSGAQVPVGTFRGGRGTRALRYQQAPARTVRTAPVLDASDDVPLCRRVPVYCDRHRDGGEVSRSGSLTRGSDSGSSVAFSGQGCGCDVRLPQSDKLGYTARL
jgi:hypothetical protein